MSESRWRVHVVKAEVEVPNVPNFLRIAGGEQTLPLSAVEDDDLRALAGLWGEELVKRAGEQRAALRNADRRER